MRRFKARLKALVCKVLRLEALWPHRLFTHVLVLLLLATVTTFLAGQILWRMAGEPDMRSWGTAGDVVKTALTVTAGIGAVVALVVAYRRQRHLEAAEARLDRAEVREDTKLFNDRFERAAAQLSSDKAASRLAGVYAMASLADDWDAGRQTCINVLCAYIRMPYTAPEGQVPTNANKERRERREQRLQERQVRHAVLNIFGERLRADTGPSTWHGHDFDLQGSTIDGGLLQGIHISGGSMDFSNAVFSGGAVSFDRADFADGEVSFRGASFVGSALSYQGAKLHGGTVSFAEAVFANGTVSFAGAVFCGSEVSFAEATFTGGKLVLSEAEFTRSDISFDGAIFSGSETSFSRAKFSGGVIHFYRAKLSGGGMYFTKTKFHGGEVSFYSSEFCGSEVHFSAAMFAGGLVWFPDARFSSGDVRFDRAQFSGCNVCFPDAWFSGGTVSFRNASIQASPPEFDKFADWPPQGLTLPASYTTRDRE